MVISYVGSGGKTTLIHRHADELRRQGKKVLVTTSTHMFVENDTLLTDDAQMIIHHLNENGYVMAGIPCGEKIGPLSRETYLSVCKHADAVLVEADGSKRMPLKFPAAHEPVIYENTDEIIVVCGLAAIGKAAKDVCHRLELVKMCLGIDDDTVITQDHVIRLLQEGYLKPLQKQYPGMCLRVHPVHDETPEMMAFSDKIKEICMQSRDI